MANVLDSLLVVLGLDASGFKKSNAEVQAGIKKTGDEAENLRKKHETEAKKTAEAFNTVRDSVLGITAAIVGAVAGGEFLSFLTKNDTAVSNLGRNVGTTAREVSLLEGVFRRMGSSTADADGFLRTTNKILQDIKLTGTSGALAPFVQAGLDVAKFRNATSPQEQLELLAGAAKKLDPRDAQYRLQAAGYSEDTVNIILQNRVALKDLFEQQGKMNVVSQDDINAAFDRQRAYGNLTETLTGLGRSIATEITPIVVAFANVFQKFIQFLHDNVPVATAIVVALGAAFVSLTAIKFAGLISGIGSITGGLGLAGTAATGLLGKLAKIGSILGVGAIADAVLTAVDPKDSTGSWIDSNIPGASAVDNFFSQFGLGRSYSQQAGNRGVISGFPIKSGSGSLGSRNNNPGNLRFAGQTGASHGAGGFAAFGSISEGLAAMDAQLTLYAKRGNDTLAGIISTYAPAGDHNNVAAYIADVAKKSGLNPSQHLNLNDSGVMRSIISAMSSHEGNPVDLEKINAGMNLAQSRGQGVGSANVNIASISINTSSSTMTGTGTDLGRSLKNNLLASQANSGVN